MNTYRRRPVLKPGKVLLILSTAFALSVLCLAILEALPKWRPVVCAVLAGGHALLAVSVIARGKLPITLPIDGAWIDVLTVFAVPWIGPAVWYYEWKKIQNKPDAMHLGADEWAAQGRHIVCISCLVLAICAVLVWVRLMISQ